MIAAGKWYIWYKSKADVFTIWNTADWHLWNRGCLRDRLQTDLNLIRYDPYSFFFGGGDYADYVGPSDPRFDPSCLPESARIEELGSLGMCQTMDVQEYLEPIKDKSLGLLFRNHEQKYMLKQQQQFLHGMLCRNLGVRNLTYAAFVEVIFQHVPGLKTKAVLSAKSAGRGPKIGSSYAVRFFLHHGAGGAITKAGKLKRLIDFMHYFEADVYMVGHVHDREGTRIDRISANAQCTELRDTSTIGIISGSYLATYKEGCTTYGEIRGYAPTSPGASFVRIKPITRKIYGEI